jgi:hypothetical protein
MSHNPIGLHGLLRGLFYFTFFGGVCTEASVVLRAVAADSFPSDNRTLLFNTFLDVFCHEDKDRRCLQTLRTY